VMDGGPGAKAGLKSGDVVLKVDGHEMESTGGFRNAIAAAGASSKAKLEIFRDGKALTLEAKLGEAPPDKEANRQGIGGSSPAGSLDGLTLEDLNPALRHRFQVPPSVKSAVVVTDVDSGSPAAESGLRPGDVVLEVNRAPVADVGSFKVAYTKSKDRALLRILRDGRTLFLVVKH
jgi:serine protease Do